MKLELYQALKNLGLDDEPAKQLVMAMETHIKEQLDFGVEGIKHLLLQYEAKLEAHEAKREAYEAKREADQKVTDAKIDALSESTKWRFDGMAAKIDAIRWFIGLGAVTVGVAIAASNFAVNYLHAHPAPPAAAAPKSP